MVLLMNFYTAMSNNKTSKKDQLLKRSRTLMDRGKIDSLSDFQDIPTIPKIAPEEPKEDKKKKPVNVEEAYEQETETESNSNALVRTKSYRDVQWKSKKPMKIARQNFRFTEELAMALENCSEERRLKKNTVVEIALEQYLKNEGYLKD